MKTPVNSSRGSFFYVLCIIFVIGVNGCATIAGSFNPRSSADEIGKNAGFVKDTLPTNFFSLTSYLRKGKPGEKLVIYIEGDGLAWKSRTNLSADPTPMHPLVLRLASMDASENVAYLARPCQYNQDPHCGPEYWSDKRFSEEVITSMNEAVDDLVIKTGAKKIDLIGYSGGGGAAALMASRRKDVNSLRTIAGNLDSDAVCRYQKVDLMKGSLNPIMAAKKISSIPQAHFVGSEDKVVPAFIAQEFKNESGNEECIQVIEIKGVKHNEGWENAWPDILKIPVKCLEKKH